MDFPYKREFYNREEIWAKAQQEDLTSVRALMQLKSNSLPQGYTYRFGKVNGLAFVSSDHCYEVNVLTDLFTEPARMEARRRNYVSPLQYYQENKDLLTKRYPDRKRQREAIFAQQLECSCFKITLSVTVYKFFEAKRVLDGSAGWGDRILGAALAGVETYVGYDPNPKLTKGYQEILAFLQRPNYRLIIQDFLQAELTQSYDLFFTSPPFYDYEIYCDHPAQSITGKRSVEQWLREFFFPYLKKGFDALVSKGFFVLYMSDTPAGQYMARVDDYMRNTLQAKFLGIIASGLESRIRQRSFPFWVWQKI